jgi:hypothetical protein
MIQFGGTLSQAQPTNIQQESVRLWCQIHLLPTFWPMIKIARLAIYQDFSDFSYICSVSLDVVDLPFIQFLPDH